MGRSSLLGFGGFVLFFPERENRYNILFEFMLMEILFGQDLSLTPVIPQRFGTAATY